jgi:hypothetical protein
MVEIARRIAAWHGVASCRTLDRGVGICVLDVRRRVRSTGPMTHHRTPVLGDGTGAEALPPAQALLDAVGRSEGTR